MCRELRATLATPGAPDDLGRLARAAGVVTVRLEAIPIDGMLVGAAPPYSVVLGAELPPTRKRYTLAHEAAHAALQTSSDACFRGGGSRSSVEREADHFAAEALLPADQLAAEAGTIATSIDELHRIAHRFRVSLEAAGLRLVELGIWNAALICWRVLPRPGSTVKLRIDWGATPPGRRLYIPKYATPPVALMKQWRESHRGAQRIRLNVGSLRGEYEVDSVPRRDSLLSVIPI